MMKTRLDATRRLMLTVTLGIAASGLAISCTPAPTPPLAAPPIAANQPITGHWVHDQRLRVVMAQLLQKNPHWPSGLPQDPESTKQGTPDDFDEVSQLAGSLMTAADQLPEVAAKLNMTEADQRGFLAEAQVLHDQASRLRDASRDHRVEQMQVHMNSLNATCISCHSRYREYSGELKNIP